MTRSKCLRVRTEAGRPVKYKLKARLGKLLQADSQLNCLTTSYNHLRKGLGRSSHVLQDLLASDFPLKHSGSHFYTYVSDVQRLGRRGVLLSCTVSQELQVKCLSQVVRWAFTVSIVSFFHYL